MIRLTEPEKAPLKWREIRGPYIGEIVPCKAKWTLIKRPDGAHELYSPTERRNMVVADGRAFRRYLIPAGI